jgi:prephenate dehydratase
LPEHGRPRYPRAARARALERAAFQGEPGAFSEAALLRLFGGTIEPVPCRTFRDVGSAVSEGTAEYGLLPVENTIAGSVAPAFDVLAATDLVVLAETVEPIRHCLLALPGAAFPQIRRALSHPVALAQCSRFFLEHPGIEAVAVLDTAGAAREVAERADHRLAAVAAKNAAAHYGLHVLLEDLQDRADNQTRFLLVARPGRTADVAPASDIRKTSLLIETENRPGALVSVLQPFAERAINLAHLECRPGDEPWTYRFIMEFEADALDPRAQSALDQVRRIATRLRVFGSFAAAPRAGGPASAAR